MKNSNLLKKNIFYFIFCLLGIVTHAQKVSNITYRQEQSTIIVSYDLETKTPCEVNLFVSTNAGTNWQGPLKKVMGDVGAKIASGSHSISWNVLEEIEELRGDNIQFQVRVKGNLITIIPAIKIGSQEWTKKNLDVSTYRNGDIIPEVKDENEWESIKTGAWCYYAYYPETGAIYGKLYNWYAVNDPRGLAPDGYHIPSDDEWSTLINYLGGKEVAGGKMKTKDTSFWIGYNQYATNESRFTGLPGGERNVYGNFEFISYFGFWWSSSQASTEKAWSRQLSVYDGFAKRSDFYKKNYGFSVRCVKD